jgi:nucleotide-binding universal stress UspA family protein
MPYQRILLAHDGSETSNKALAAALDMARGTGGRVRVIHAVDELASASGYEYSGELMRLAREQGKKILDGALATARSAGVESDTRMLEAPGKRLGEVVADEAAAWPADLVVVGTHGRRGLGRVLLGSGAESVIRLSAVPVLVIRSEDKGIGS